MHGNSADKLRHPRSDAYLPQKTSIYVETSVVGAFQTVETILQRVIMTENMKILVNCA